MLRAPDQHGPLKRETGGDGFLSSPLVVVSRGLLSKDGEGIRNEGAAVGKVVKKDMMLRARQEKS